MSIFEPMVLPFLAPNFHKPGKSSAISAPSTKAIFQAGPAFLAHARRVTQNRTFEQDDQIEADHESRHGTPEDTGSDDEDQVESEPESSALLNLDPKEWKQQDHYAVLGLSNLRWKATQGQIKKAHRKKVLKHHPDKKASQAHDSNDDSFFKCIAKAHEVLSNKTRRRQFDSVDPAIDNDDFPHKAIKPEQFVEAWAPVFARECRFGEDPASAPQLGDMESSKAHVEKFYEYWYNFQSWRSFEYDDKEANEGDDSRDQKRYAEKKNKAERARKKKDDNARLRTIVDNALATDPRIKKFKQEEKAARDAKRKPKPAEAAKVDLKKKQEEEKAAAEEAAKKQADDKVSRDAAKKTKEAAKKNLKRDKKAISALVTSLNYFYKTGETVPALSVEGYLTELDLILNAQEPEDIAALRAETDKSKDDREKVKSAIGTAGKAKSVNMQYFA